MKVSPIFLLCILGAALLSTVLCNSGNAPNDCCFELYEKRMNKNLFISYYETDPRCHLNATVLITIKERLICVNPKIAWVKKIINFLEEKSL